MTDRSDLRLAIDIGGTFTDTVLASADNRILATTKTATTPDNPTIGALEGAKYVLEKAGRNLGEVGLFVHGTTLATNALIERKGSQVATVTTKGFRDILEIAYERRYSQYDIEIDKPDLIVPRSRSFTIDERLDFRGEILTPLDENCIDHLVEDIRQSKADAVAICLLHAYTNPVHELRLQELLMAQLPDLSISISSEVSPEAREFDRLCTTIANAYIQPLMSTYLKSFVTGFSDAGLKCPILMMTASGGITTIDTASQLPIRLVESGPAGGAILASHIAEQIGENKVLSFDMGGTTAKLCLIDDFKPQSARKFEIARAARFVKGSGMPVRIPVLEMIEIGAGGGSIAEIDNLGRLQVGPRSAGSEPGPAAFGNGGDHATVTDADFALGYLEQSGFAEGRIKIDLDASNKAITKCVAILQNLDVMQGAAGISEIVDESMASAARMHAVESGKNLGERVMIAFGGNGPLHATRVARRSGVEKIIIPKSPGVGSAVGFLYAPISFEIVRSRYTTLPLNDLCAINNFLASMFDEASSVVQLAGEHDNLNCLRTAFMRYHGQGHEIEIALPNGMLVNEDLVELTGKFESEYSRLFSLAVPGMTIEILNWGVTVSAPSSRVKLAPKISRSKKIQSNSMRKCICDVTGSLIEAAVFHRSVMSAGDEVDGPAFIVESQTTTFVSTDFTALVDLIGNVILSKKPNEGPRS